MFTLYFPVFYYREQKLKNNITGMFFYISTGKKKLMHFEFRFQDYNNVVYLCSAL